MDVRLSHLNKVYVMLFQIKITK